MNLKKLLLSLIRMVWFVFIYLLLTAFFCVGDGQITVSELAAVMK